nr:hypothetical protein [Tanacetum cinerariifolium]
MSLPLLLAAHLGRNEKGQHLQSSLTSFHEGRHSSINIGGNLPPNDTFLSHHVQPFIPSSGHVPNGFVHNYVNPYSQPFTGIINGKTPSFPFQAQTGNPSVGGTSVYPPQGWSHSHVKMANACGLSHVYIYPQGLCPNMMEWSKSREGESVRAFTTRYTDDTLQLLGLHKDHRISGFVHGLRTRNLIEHLSIDLPSTYKGLMEKTYTWIEAREVTTNEAPNDQKDNFESLFESLREILVMEKVAKTSNNLHGCPE